MHLLLRLILFLGLSACVDRFVSIFSHLLLFLDSCVYILSIFLHLWVCLYICVCVHRSVCVPLCLCTSLWPPGLSWQPLVNSPLPTAVAPRMFSLGQWALALKLDLGPMLHFLWGCVSPVLCPAWSFCFRQWGHRARVVGIGQRLTRKQNTQLSSLLREQTSPAQWCPSWKGLQSYKDGSEKGLVQVQKLST